MPEKVLITGASGRIGQLLIKHFKDQYDFILTDKNAPQETHGFPYSEIEIADSDSVKAVFAKFPDIHTVIHLAADPSTTAVWESLLPNNIVGTYNVFEVAHKTNCKRIIYASSINAVDGYQKDMQIHTSMPVAPANLYGASKAWGEALGRFYADYKNMAVHCLRIGWVTPKQNEFIQNGAPNELLHMTLTHEDLLKFFEACFASEHRFGIWHVISNNLFKRLDLSDTKEKLGYEPQDDGYTLSGKVKNLQ